MFMTSIPAGWMLLHFMMSCLQSEDELAVRIWYRALQAAPRQQGELLGRAIHVNAQVAQLS